MTVEVSPTKLDINPVFVASGTIGNILDISDKRWSGDVPLQYKLVLYCTN